MGIVQEVAPNKDAALKVGIDIANRIAACGPLGIKATLKAAHLGINDSADAAAYATLEAEYVRLYSSQDFLEGRKAETENRPPSSRSIKEVTPTERVTKRRTPGGAGAFYDELGDDQRCSVWA